MTAYPGAAMWWRGATAFGSGVPVPAVCLLLAAAVHAAVWWPHGTCPFGGSPDWVCYSRLQFPGPEYAGALPGLAAVGLAAAYMTPENHTAEYVYSRATGLFLLYPNASAEHWSPGPLGYGLRVAVKFGDPPVEFRPLQQVASWLHWDGARAHSYRVEVKAVRMIRLLLFWNADGGGLSISVEAPASRPGSQWREARRIAMPAPPRNITVVADGRGVFGYVDGRLVLAIAEGPSDAAVSLTYDELRQAGVSVEGRPWLYTGPYFFYTAAAYFDGTARPRSPLGLAWLLIGNSTDDMAPPPYAWPMLIGSMMDAGWSLAGHAAVEARPPPSGNFTLLRFPEVPLKVDGQTRRTRLGALVRPPACGEPIYVNLTPTALAPGFLAVAGPAEIRCRSADLTPAVLAGIAAAAAAILLARHQRSRRTPARP